MAEFYDEVFDERKIDYDVDIIYPDGTKTEMFLERIPKVGEMMFGHIVSKITLESISKDNECEARIELKRKEQT